MKQTIIKTAFIAACTLGVLYNRGHISNEHGSPDPTNAVIEATAQRRRRRLNTLDLYKDPKSVASKRTKISTSADDVLEDQVSLKGTLDTSIGQVKKPIAVLHIGPHKTGTTALQRFITEHELELRNDGFHMPWKMKSYESANEFQFASCFLTGNRKVQMSSRRNDICPPEELPRLQKLGQEGKSIFLSAEAFSYITDVAPLAEFLEHYWDVHIIYFHRWYYDWLFSNHNQTIKVILKQAMGNFDKFIANRGRGKLLRSFVVQFEHMHKEDFAMEIESYRSFYKYSKYFDNVVTLDYEDESVSVTENVFCNAMKNSAKHTCERILQEKGEMVHINGAQSLVYKSIAYAANELAMMTYCSKEHFEDVVEKIQNHQESTLGLSSSDFPARCLSDTILDRIIEVSLEHRRQILSHDPLSKEDEDRIREEYQEKMEKTSCDPDIKAILEMPEWMEFFDTLNNENESCSPVLVV
mmetsp:Transcript_17353/g.29925  ORF Transcript_17353/g.29925 Transcript_17353/m.29925 type:complete len:469 (+) Transcript_17353:67-1473(+)|eukprot:CAMPEP_0183702774 /NCGR_PEP_ID=MMETSP0737-20130205/775_1 /TAXON_ID=385413 /ORGANISM="Thalassiosira miniscula, Strain CCMP1093" /LENGTH=468 /DNA_ID=CAMNT_0025929447 /DNA_START=225 /DNA_END=1631 /DNA_ORIENTATION=-